MMLFSVVAPYGTVFATSEQNINKTEIKTYENEDNYTEDYKRYLELSDEEKAKVEVIPSKYKVPLDMIYEDTEIVTEEPTISNVFGLFASTKLQASDAEKLPSKYNLGDDINILIENQGSEGNCWNFASMKSLETYLLLNGYGEFDFSEKHLDYIESEEFSKYGLSGAYRKLHDGGNFQIQFYDYVKNELGPVLEEEAPYDREYNPDEYQYLLNLKPKAYVGECINFPTIQKEWETYTDEELRLFREKIKKHIIKNGSIYASIIAPQYHSDYWNPETYASYMPKYEPEFASSYHAISIIGWDDNYSKENFNEKHRPSTDGAYIALNSWGKSFGDNGLFYISYEDYEVESGMWGILSASTNREDVKDKQTPTKNISGKEIQFKDANLYSAIKEKYTSDLINCDDLNLKLELTGSIINMSFSLDLSDKGIVDLSGIEQFEKLEYLNLANNQIYNIEPLTKLSNLFEIDLSNNQITTLYEIGRKNEETGKRELWTFNLSGNKIVNNFEVIKEIGLWNVQVSNCGLTDENLNILKQIIEPEGWPMLTMDLSKNDFQDVSCLTNIKSTLDLSENFNIDISKISNNIYHLKLRNCNLNSLASIDLSNMWTLDVSENENLDITSNLNMPNIYNLYIGDNKNITNETLDLLKTLPVRVLDISNTNITELEKINEFPHIQELNISGNKNISLDSIKELTNIGTLIMQNWDIEDYKELYKELSNVKNFYRLDLSHNKIKEIYSGYDDYYDNFYDDDETVGAIQTIARNNIKKNSPILRGDDDEWTDEEDDNHQLMVNLDYNNILAVDTYIPSYIESYKNQTINIDVDIIAGEENRFEKLGTLIGKQNTYRGESVTLENCSMDKKKNELIIKSNEENGIAKIKIKGGDNDGFNCTINFKTVSDISKMKIEQLIIEEEANKTTYMIGQNFDKTGIKLKAIFENGCSKEISNFEVINGENLQEEQYEVTLRYMDEECKQWIWVINPENTEILNLNKMNDELFRAVVDNIYPIDYDIANKTITIYKGELQDDEYNEYNDEEYDDNNGISLYLDDEKYNISDLTGLSQLGDRLTDIVIIGGTYSDISELGKLSKLKSVTIRDNKNIINIDTLANCKGLERIDIEGTQISDLSKLKNIKNTTIKDSPILNIDINSILENMTDENDWLNLQASINENDLQEQNGKIVLPKYIKELKDSELKIKAYTVYVNRDEKYVNALKKVECPIEENSNDLFVKLDKEVSKDKKQLKRYIEIEVKENIEAENYKWVDARLKINYEAENTWEGIEITKKPNKTTYTEGESFDNTGMVVSKVFADESKQEITNYTINQNGPFTTKGEKILTISYTENGITKTTTLNVNVVELEKIPYNSIDNQKYVTELTVDNNIVSNLISTRYFVDTNKVKAIDNSGQVLNATDI